MGKYGIRLIHAELFLGELKEQAAYKIQDVHQQTAGIGSVYTTFSGENVTL